MKGLDKIIGRIRADAMAEIDAIRAEGYRFGTLDELTGGLT